MDDPGALEGRLDRHRPVIEVLAGILVRYVGTAAGQDLRSQLGQVPQLQPHLRLGGQDLVGFVPLIRRELVRPRGHGPGVGL